VDGGIQQSIVNVFREISAALPYMAISVAVFAASLLIAHLAARLVNTLVPLMRFDANLASLLGGFLPASTMSVTLCRTSECNLSKS
jgi:hypothetical protein